MVEFLHGVVSILAVIAMGARLTQLPVRWKYMGTLLRPIATQLSPPILIIVMPHGTSLLIVIPVGLYIALFGLEYIQVQKDRLPWILLRWCHILSQLRSLLLLFVPHFLHINRMVRMHHGAMADD